MSDFKDFSKRYSVTPTAKKIIDGEQLGETERKCSCYAWGDVLQSVTGLLLGLFLFCHMAFTSSILFGTDGSVFKTLVAFSGGSWLDGGEHLWMHVVLIGTITLLVIIHALMALRKFPANLKAFMTMRGHYRLIRHTDTTLWWLQFITAIFLTALVFYHVIPMLMNPGEIGPEGSGLVVYDSWLWVIFLFLLVTETHGMIGLYRLCMKWCGPSDKAREVLRKVMYCLIVFMVCLGSCTIIGFHNIGEKVANGEIPYSIQK